MKISEQLKKDVNDIKSCIFVKIDIINKMMDKFCEKDLCTYGEYIQLIDEINEELRKCKDDLRLKFS
jgi:hypothetical protein